MAALTFATFLVGVCIRLPRLPHGQRLALQRRISRNSSVPLPHPVFERQPGTETPSLNAESSIADRAPVSAFDGCVFIISPLVMRNWTAEYRVEFMKWHITFLITSLAAQTDNRFRLLISQELLYSEREQLSRALSTDTLVFANTSTPTALLQLVQKESCSWVVTVSVDGDDVVAPWWIEDLHAVSRREISTAPFERRAIVVATRHLTSLKVDVRGSEVGLRCRIGTRSRQPWPSGSSMAQAIIARREHFIRTAGVLIPGSFDHRTLDRKVAKIVGCTEQGCVMIADYPRDTGVYLIGRLSSNFPWDKTMGICNMRSFEDKDSALRGFGLEQMLMRATLPTFGKGASCVSNRNVRLKAPGVKIDCTLLKSGVDSQHARR